VKFSLSLTHRCNLACRYCYAGKAFKKDMPLVTAKKIIDFAFNITLPGEIMEFCFFGGEPLLVFNLMEKAVGYIQVKQHDRNQNIHLSVTTNGTLLTQHILDYLQNENVSLCVSIDGPAYIHNQNRRYSDGRGSFEDVLKNLKRAVQCLDDVQVNAVYGPEIINFLPNIISFFIHHGISTIHLNPDITATWHNGSYDNLKNIYMQIAKYYIRLFQQGKELAINLLDSKILVFLKNGYMKRDKCGMGETEWGFAPSGNIYPCERFIGEDNNIAFCLGNIHTGFNLMRRCSLLKQSGNCDEKCITCTLRNYCMNWCGCTNYFLTGNMNLVGSMMCASEKAALIAAYHALLTLKDNDLFLNHFLKYFDKRGITTSFIEREVIE
jgi:uncharacterized protein